MRRSRDHREPAPSRPKRRGRLVLILVGAAACAAPIFWYGVIPYPWTLAGNNPERTALMEQRVQDARNQDAPFELRQEWATLDEISPNLVRAVLTAEDYRFREHRGIDWVSLAEEVHWTGDEDFSWRSPSDVRALIAAIGYVRANRDSIRGRSTITQQLAKNLYFGAERTFARKAVEFVVAGRLERRLGKDRILELYLNVAEWGPGVFGASAAARTYFGRSASSLTLEEAAALAATLPHPLTSNPAYRPARMLWRKDLILRRLDPSSRIPAAPMPFPEPVIDTTDLAQPPGPNPLEPADTVSTGTSLPGSFPTT